MFPAIQEDVSYNPHLRKLKVHNLLIKFFICR